MASQRSFLDLVKHASEAGGGAAKERRYGDARWAARGERVELPQGRAGEGEAGAGAKEHDLCL